MRHGLVMDMGCGTNLISGNTPKNSQLWKKTNHHKSNLLPITELRSVDLRVPGREIMINHWIFGQTPMLPEYVSWDATDSDWLRLTPVKSQQLVSLWSGDFYQCHLEAPSNLLCWGSVSAILRQSRCQKKSAPNWSLKQAMNIVKQPIYLSSILY